jgi:hypothetical protein
MSTENNIDDLNLVHEDYISEKGIDETTIPAAIKSRIDALDKKVDAYLEMDELDENGDALEVEIAKESKAIKEALQIWEVNGNEPTPPAGNEPPKPAAPTAGGEPPAEGQPPKPVEKKGSGIALFDMLGLD